MTALSILIPSVHTRWDNFAARIQTQIWGQYQALNETDQGRVEVIIVTDNKARPIGDKRNTMLAMAQGDYVAFVDDDDALADNYLQALLHATDTGHDVITFDVSVTLNGGRPKICRYSKDFRADRNLPTSYERLPNHLMCVRRELAQQAKFPVINCGEDAVYAKALHPLLTTEHRINQTLYHYLYDDTTTETQS